MAGLYSGLYVAGASLVCFCLILHDIIMAGFRKKKRWLPCHYFSLNSLTLTILTAASKLTADLTTRMPSPQEQLSKLTSTAMLCTCVCFMVPSLGVNGDTECWNNMLSLSILIITVIVDICIQVHTGIIVLFKTEHIIILCCMFMLLLALICLAYDIITHRKISLDENRELFKKGKGSMSDRLKLCFQHAYDSNPQLELCRDEDNIFVNFLCALSSVVVIQAAFRAIILKELKFSNEVVPDYKWLVVIILKEWKLSHEVSNYKWSIGIIVATQIATILVGCFDTTFRWFSLAYLMKDDSLGSTWTLKDAAIEINPILHTSLRESRVYILLLGTVISIPELVVAATFYILRSAICGYCSGEWDDWTRIKADEDMKKWMHQVKKCDEHIFRLLSTIHPSQHSLAKKLKDKAHKVSSLSVVILARIASVCVPSTLSGSLLTKVLHEVFEVIQFVDKKIYKNMKESEFAKAAIKGKDLTSLFPVAEIIDGAMLNRESHVSEATDILFSKIKEKLPDDSEDLANRELRIITDFITEEIRNQNFATIESLYGFMRQLFVDMLNEFLVQLPNAIFKEIIESSPENHEDAIRFALKVLLQIESLEGIVQWSYPIETDITHLITDDDGRP